MKKPAHPLWIFFACVLFVSVIAWATPIQVTIESNPTTITIHADTPLRFIVDYTARTILIPEANTTNLPNIEGLIIDVRNEGLLLRLTESFTVSLSANNRDVMIVRTPTNPNSPATGNDERAPTIYFLANALPAQVASLLTRLYPSLRIEVDERQRAIIVLLNPKDKAVVEPLIKVLDAPRPQVMFEAEILEINRAVTQQLGIDYTKLINLNFRFFEATVPTGQLVPQTFSRNPLSLEFGINLLKTSGAGRTLARPRAATLDGIEARINATQTQPIRTVGANSTVSVTNITTGINLRFLPKVAPDQFIESQVSITVSSPQGFTSEGLPVYSTRDANVTVRVRNGEPIVIGGLLESRQSTSSTGVPGLMDIPVVGDLFKNTFNEERQTDLVIIVTPFIVGTNLNPNQSTDVPLVPAPSQPALPQEP